MTVTASAENIESHEIKPSYPLQPWVVILSAALFFFYEFIQMNMFNAIDPSLIRDFHVTATELGNLSATYSYGNVLFLFVAGMLLDRISTKKLLLTAIVTCVIFTYLFSMSATLFQAEICRFITGVASTFCMLSSVRLASRWLPPRRIALAIGLVLTFAMSGGMLAQTPLTYMVHAFGWRHAVMMNASLGVLFTLIIVLLVKDFPKGAEFIREREREALRNVGFWMSIWLAIRNMQNWFAGIFTNILSFPIVILGATWGSFYLMHVRHLTHLQSTYVTSMIFLGTIFGSPIIGALSDFIGFRKWPMIVGGFLSLFFILLIMYLPNLSLYELMLLFFLLSFVASCQVISYPLVVESNSRMITTTAEGLTCTIIMSAGLFQMVYGALLDMNWHGAMAHGMRVYSAHDYQIAMLMFPAAFVIAIGAAFFIKETRCQHLVK